MDETTTMPQVPTPNSTCMMCGAPLTGVLGRCPRCGELVNFPKKRSAGPQRLRTVVFRFCSGIVLGAVVGGLLMLGQALTEGIHPPDLWYYLRVYQTIGLIAGTIVGLAWSAAAYIGLSPPKLKSSIPEN
jgi:hypothetical protein